MITVRTKSSLNVKEVVRFFNRNFPEAVLKVSSLQGGCPLPAPSSGRKSLTPKGQCCGTIHGVAGGGLGRRARGSPPCPPQERHHTKAQYQLKSEQISLAQVFSKMEQVVDVLGIEDYSVSQTTLDNVRAGMARVAGCLSPGGGHGKEPSRNHLGGGGRVGWGHGGGHSLAGCAGAYLQRQARVEVLTGLLAASRPVPARCL